MKQELSKVREMGLDAGASIEYELYWIVEVSVFCYSDVRMNNCYCNTSRSPKVNTSRNVTLSLSKYYYYTFRPIFAYRLLITCLLVSKPNQNVRKVWAEQWTRELISQSKNAFYELQNSVNHLMCALILVRRMIYSSQLFMLQENNSKTLTRAMADPLHHQTTKPPLNICHRFHRRVR